MSEATHSQSEGLNHISKILLLFTRTPLHVGAGSSVGAIDQPVIRERHTGFPVVPATSLKGTFADEWNVRNGDGKIERSGDGQWLFGSTDANSAWAGALQFSEARLIAFPLRSARGSFAWITCSLMLARASRDGVSGIKALAEAEAKCFANSDGDSRASFAADGPLALKAKDGSSGKTQIVLEEYTFTHAGELPDSLTSELAKLLPEDSVWTEIKDRLVILSNGMMSYFAKNACEVAQHVRIDDETGTAAGGALFNQENVPSETMFYSVLHALDERTPDKAKEDRRKAKAALETFHAKVGERKVFQFGGDASTGLGFCTVKLNEAKGA